MVNYKKYIKITGVIAFVVIGTMLILFSDDIIEDKRITGFPTDFNKQTFNVNLDTQPTDIVTMTFSARIPPTSSGVILDYLPGYVIVNNVGVFSRDVGGSGRWNVVPVTNTKAFEVYSVDLPADLNNDGVVDWKEGSNHVTLWTVSAFRSHVGQMEVEWIKFE